MQVAMKVRKKTWEQELRVWQAIGQAPGKTSLKVGASPKMIRRGKDFWRPFKEGGAKGRKAVWSGQWKGLLPTSLVLPFAGQC